MKNSIKRLLTFILVLSLLCSLFGCFNSNEDKGGEAQKAEPKPYSVTYVTDYSNIKNVILIIGDGMGEEHLDAGELAAGKKFSFREDFNRIFADTNSLDRDTNEATVTTDSSASATAIATGVLTYNNRVSIGESFEEFTTVLDIAKTAGKSTAVVTTDYLCGATPAAFTAHVLNRGQEIDIVKSQAKSGVDLLIGQYYDLYDRYESNIKENYNYFKEYDRDSILDLKSEDSLCLFQMEKSTEDSVSLKEATDLAVDYLKDDSDGFVLVVEQAHIDKSCHNSDVEGTARAASSLNDTVETVLNFAKDRNDTAVIITADHETGGLKVSSDTDEYESQFIKDDNAVFSYEYSTTNHTSTNVPVYYSGFGLKPELFRTYSSQEKLKNCEIFLIMKDLIMYSQLVEE